MNLLRPQGPDADRIANLFWLMLTLGTVIYIVTMTLLVIAVFRGRAKERPSRLTDNAFIVAGGVVVPTLVLAVLAAATVRVTNRVTAPSRNPLAIEVVGYQFWWRVDYPTANTTANTTANEIHIPVGRPVDLGLTSVDVIHSFWVPELAGKLDMIPGQRNVLHVKADRAGTYRGVCAEFCGLQHAHMALAVVAEPPDQFDAWLRNQARPASKTASEGQAVFERASCAGCHTIRGTAADGALGPDLTHLASRGTIGALTLDNNRANLARWIVDAQSVKRGSLMPPTELKGADLDALLDYLEGLE